MATTSRINYLRALGVTVTALVLFAVPAVAIGLADFSATPQVNLASQTGQPAAGEDLVVLNNWQFTDGHHTDHPIHTDHPRNTDHRSTQHPTTDHRHTAPVTHHTDHKSQFTCFCFCR